MLLSLFIVSAFILVICEIAEEKKQKKIQRQKMTFIRYLLSNLYCTKSD